MRFRPIIRYLACLEESNYCHLVEWCPSEKPIKWFRWTASLWGCPDPVLWLAQLEPDPFSAVPRHRSAQFESSWRSRSAQRSQLYTHPSIWTAWIRETKCLRGARFSWIHQCLLAVRGHLIFSLSTDSRSHFSEQATHLRRLIGFRICYFAGRRKVWCLRHDFEGRSGIWGSWRWPHRHSQFPNWGSDWTGCSFRRRLAWPTWSGYPAAGRTPGCKGLGFGAASRSCWWWARSPEWRPGSPPKSRSEAPTPTTRSSRSKALPRTPFQIRRIPTGCLSCP